MEKQLKKTNGNQTAVFRKITITSTVLTYIMLILALACFVFSIWAYTEFSKEQYEDFVGAPTEQVLVGLIVGIIVLILLSAFALSITQGVLAKKVGMIGNKIHPQLASNLLITFVTLAIFVALCGLLILVLAIAIQPDHAADEQLFNILKQLKLNVCKISILLLGVSTLFALVPPVFNTILCAKTKK